MPEVGTCALSHNSAGSDRANFSSDQPCSARQTRGTLHRQRLFLRTSSAAASSTACRSASAASSRARARSSSARARLFLLRFSAFAAFCAFSASSSASSAAAKSSAFLPAAAWTGLGFYPRGNNAIGRDMVTGFNTRSSHTRSTNGQPAEDIP